MNARPCEMAIAFHMPQARLLVRLYGSGKLWWYIQHANGAERTALLRAVSEIVGKFKRAEVREWARK